MRLTELQRARHRAYRFQFPTSRYSAINRGIKTAFLSHSHKDIEYAKGLQVVLAEQGFIVYIDWEDPGMPETPDRRTAERIQQKIKETNWFLFLATPNSTASRWCPWELTLTLDKTGQTVTLCPGPLSLRARASRDTPQSSFSHKKIAQIANFLITSASIA